MTKCKEDVEQLQSQKAAGGISTEKDAGRYRAPALEKGLDVIELLAAAPTGLTLTAIVQALRRSNGELFRMIQVLQFRGYIDQNDRDGAYRLTDKLFSLGMEQPRMRSLVESALPAMRSLALALGQSCHLAVHSRGEIVVVARMESGEQIGLSVRVGYRRPLIETASGTVLYAYQPDEVRENWRQSFKTSPSRTTLAKFHEKCARTIEVGHCRQPSSFVDGVTDVSAPIIRNGQAAAALTVPFLKTKQLAIPLEEAVSHLVIAANEISAALIPNDLRV